MMEDIPKYILNLVFISTTTYVEKDALPTFKNISDDRWRYNREINVVNIKRVKI